MRARVLKVVPTLMCGGTENQFMTLGRRLDRSRFDLEFACLRRWGPFVDELQQLGIPLEEYQVATFRSVHALTQQARLARLLGREKRHLILPSVNDRQSAGPGLQAPGFGFEPNTGSFTSGLVARTKALMNLPSITLPSAPPIT